MAPRYSHIGLLFMVFPRTRRDHHRPFRPWSSPPPGRAPEVGAVIATAPRTRASAVSAHHGTGTPGHRSMGCGRSNAKRSRPDRVGGIWSYVEEKRRAKTCRIYKKMAGSGMVGVWQVLMTVHGIYKLRSSSMTLSISEDEQDLTCARIYVADRSI